MLRYHANLGMLIHKIEEEEINKSVSDNQMQTCDYD